MSTGALDLIAPATPAGLAGAHEKVKTLPCGIARIVVHESRAMPIERTERSRWSERGGWR